MQFQFENTPFEFPIGSIANALNAVELPAHSVARIAYRFVTPSEMALLQETYKRVPGPTNILTFVSDSRADVAICPQIATNDAAERGWDPSSELIYLAIHGALHAVGFDHNETASTERMRAIEQRVLTDIGIDTEALVTSQD